MDYGSYTYPNTSDDPDKTDVLRNRFGISSWVELRVAEYRSTTARLVALELGHGPAGNFNIEHLQAIHEFIFRDVYEWAGHRRDQSPIVGGMPVEPIGIMRKGDVAFLHGSRLEMGLNEALRPIRNLEILRASSMGEFANRAGDVLAELNYVHPFREGNGRTQEAFISALARASGHDLDFSYITRARMINVSREVIHDRSSSAMRELVLDAVDPLRRAALGQIIHGIRQQGREPFEFDIRTALPGQKVSGLVVDLTDQTVTLATDGKWIVGDRSNFPEQNFALGAISSFKAGSGFTMPLQSHLPMKD